MLGLEQIRGNRKIVNSIDWSMTPEKAIVMYLDWGTDWDKGNDLAHRKNDESLYFVIYEWEQPPQATLLRRTVGGADQIGKISVPTELFQKACDEDGYRSGVGVHPLNWELKGWLYNAVGASSTDLQIH